MPRLNTATSASLRTAPLGPGVFIGNLVDFTPQGILDVLGGDTSKGISFGAMTAAPSVSIAREAIDLTENYVGINAPIKGASQTQRTDVSIAVEIAELTYDNMEYIHPGFTRTAWTSSIPASLTVGTANSAFKVTSKLVGVAGNTTTINVATPAGATTSVTYTAPAITVNPKTAETASGVAAAINAHAGASAVVRAGLPNTSNGSGAVALFASAPLAGGAAGTTIGAKFKPTGNVPLSAYLDNVVVAAEGANANVLHIFRMNNSVQTDDLDFSPDDGGLPTSISCTFTGHVSDSDRDPVTGIYAPPYEWFVLDPASNA